MYQIESLKDTITAISTPSGTGGIGIVRLSGQKALSVADQIFESNSGLKPSQFKNYTVHYGFIKQGDETIDEVLLTVMRAPKSYTKEDVVEISSHGGIVPLRAILTLTLDSGARLAEAGEFTKRAFLNGRIDLTQAEAVLDIINAKTETFLKVSHNQLKGELSNTLEEIRLKLMEIYTEIEAIVNFPEDDIDAKARGELAQKVEDVGDQVTKLLESSEHGKILKEGIKLVLCGKPNVGKSSLLNVLLKQPRAIVTEIAGTTRDTIEETAHIKGIPFQLVDTAGVLEPRDLIEKEAVKRSHMYMDQADLVLFVVEGNSELSETDKKLIDMIRNKNVLVIMNKTDLPQVLDEKDLLSNFHETKLIKVSALKEHGLENLEERIVDNVWHGHVVDTHGVLISNIRHVEALKNCIDTIKSATDNLKNNLSLEFISEDIKSSVNFLDNITGRNIDNDLLDKIFSEFCIGK